MSFPKVILLSIPGLRRSDLSVMPALAALADAGQVLSLDHHFPAVTWPSQANMLTGKLPQDHGVIANGFFWRDENRVEMWTAWNEKIERPQIWDLLHEVDPEISSAAWFPMLSKGCGADLICMPAPIHRPDGSEDLWCYTRPQEFYGDLLNDLGHFPLQHFWGPLANIKSTQWIVDSAVQAAERFAPNFFYIYLPHLDYAAQKYGPDSSQAASALGELDQVIAQLVKRFVDAYAEELKWIAVSEYTIDNVSHVVYPNRILREAGLLQITRDPEDKELIDFESSQAWALVDHQFSHVFVRDPSVIAEVIKLFQNRDGIEHVLPGSEMKNAGLGHSRSGEVVLGSAENSWQAYYWWHEDDQAPGFAHQVDIHRKPGYDPVELFFDMTTKSVPLDATLVRGSHGRGIMASQNATGSTQSILLTNIDQFSEKDRIVDTDVCQLTMKLFDRT